MDCTAEREEDISEVIHTVCVSKRGSDMSDVSVTACCLKEEISVSPKVIKIMSYTECISGVSVDYGCFTSSQFAYCSAVLAER